MTTTSDQSGFGMPCIRPAAFLLACIAIAAPSTADAYIGPGAGFAVLGSFAVLFVTMLLAGASLLVWPFRMLWRAIRRRTKSKPLVTSIVPRLVPRSPVHSPRAPAEGGGGQAHRIRLPGERSRA